MTRRRQVIFTVPHSCILSRPALDPKCDRNSLRFARRLHAAVPGSDLIQSRTLRAECDNNRLWCRARTPMRRRLTERMSRLRAEGRSLLVVDVHTFGRSLGGRWPEAALLDTFPISVETQRLYGELRERGIDVILIPGSTRNDIQLETKRDFGGRAVLLEIFQDLGPDRIDRIGRAVAEISRAK